MLWSVEVPQGRTLDVQVDLRPDPIEMEPLVVTAVRSGLLSLEAACARYNISIEEFLSWQRLIESHGVPGLRATRLQDYRQPSPADGVLD